MNIYPLWGLRRVFLDFLIGMKNLIYPLYNEEQEEILWKATISFWESCDDWVSTQSVLLFSIGRSGFLVLHTLMRPCFFVYYRKNSTKYCTIEGGCTVEIKIFKFIRTVSVKWLNKSLSLKFVLLRTKSTTKMLNSA